MSGDPLLPEEQAMFQELEEALWREETRFDRARMEPLFAADFFEFGGSGNIHAREATLAIKPAPIKATLPLSDFKARRLSSDVVQVTYNSIVEKDGVIQRRRRSSIWTRTATGWVIRFHQGTPYTPAE